MSVRALATVLSAAVGLIAIVLGIQTSFSIFNIIAFVGMSRGASTAPVLTGDLLALIAYLAVVPIALISLGIWLLAHPPRRLVRFAEAQDGPPATGWSQALVILIVGMTILGVYLISNAGARVMMHMARAAAGSASPKPYYSSYLGPAQDWVMIGGDVLQLLIGLYLFFGAGPLCRWQMRRLQRWMYQSPAEYGYEPDSQAQPKGDPARPPDDPGAGTR